MRKSLVLILGLLFVVTLCGSFVRAQSGAVRKGAASAAAPVLPPSNAPSSNPAALYDEAANYVSRKFAEFRRDRVPFSQTLADETAREGRDLAARYAGQLAARGNLAGADFYYLGQLYHLAGQAKQSVEPLSRFLADGAAATTLTPEQLQDARFVLTFNAAGAGQLEQAEAAFAAYIKDEPHKINETIRLRSALASAYFNAGKLEPAAAHAADAYQSAKLTPDKSAEAGGRAKLISASGVFLAGVYLKLGRQPEAFRTMEELLRFGLTLPSAYVYARAAELLDDNGRADYIMRAVDDVAKIDAAATAPEIEVATWIEQKPASLSDLRGRVVLLDFWATWCGPCRVTMPKLKDLHEKYKNKGLTIVGLTQFYGRSGETPAEELALLKDFKRGLKLPYAFAVAADGDNHLRYGVGPIPTAILLDRRGRVRFITVGAGEANHAAMTKVIDKLLAEPAQ